MLKNKTKRLIKDHPEIFNAADNESDFSIAESEVPDIQWFYDANQSIIDSEKSSKKKQWYLSKRFIVPVTAAMILGIFLGATPTGRAMVHNIYKTVATWTENEVKINHGVEVPPEKNDIVVDNYTFHSIQEVQDTFNISVIGSSIGVLNKIDLEKTDFSTILFMTYSLEHDQSITITQEIFESPDAEGSTTLNMSNGQIVQEKTLDNIEFYGNVNNKVGYALGFKDDIVFCSRSESITYDLFVDFIRNLQMIDPKVD